MNYLSDLIDDLDHKQLTTLVNLLALQVRGSRAMIKRWRKNQQNHGYAVCVRKIAAEHQSEVVSIGARYGVDPKDVALDIARAWRGDDIC